MDDKVYLDANSVTRDSFAFGRMIYDSGFRPEVIIALWRGGTPIGVVVQEYLHYRGVKCYHTAVKTSAYTGIGTYREPVIENMDAVISRIQKGTRVLVVDDIFDSGSTLKAVRTQLMKTEGDIRFATLYYKPSRNQVGFEPDFYFKTTDRWLVFPHELMGLTPDEIRDKDPEVYALLGY